MLNGESYAEVHAFPCVSCARSSSTCVSSGDLREIASLPQRNVASGSVAAGEQTGACELDSDYLCT